MRYGVRLVLAAWLSYATIATAADYAVVAGHGAVCSAALAHLNARDATNGELELLDRTRQAKSLSLPAPLTPTLSRTYDFDNDGVSDEVFQYDNGGSYLNGTLLYVIPGDMPARMHGGSAKLSDVRIFPCQFDPSAHSAAACPTVSQEMDGAGITVRLQGSRSPVFFHGRYTAITPVRFRRATYLILRGATHDTRPYAAVIRPFDGTRYSSVCLFAR